MAISRDGTTLLAVYPNSNAVSLIDTSAQMVLAELLLGMGSSATLRAVSTSAYPTDQHGTTSYLTTKNWPIWPNLGWRCPLRGSDTPGIAILGRESEYNDLEPLQHATLARGE